MAKRVPYDRARVIALIDDEIARRTHHSAPDIARAVAPELFKEAIGGDWDAQVIILEMTCGAITQMAGQRIREAGLYRVRVGWNGHSLEGETPQRLAIAQRKSDGTVSKEKQYALWIDETFEVVLSKRNEMAAQRDSLGVNVQAFDRALALRRRVPMAHTPAEAAHILGIDIEQYLETGT